MQKTIVTCDNPACGKEIPNTMDKLWEVNFHYQARDFREVHACSRECCRIAVARRIGITIDGKALPPLPVIAEEDKEALAEKDRQELTRLRTLVAQMSATEARSGEQIRQLYSQVMDLEEQLKHADAVTVSRLERVLQPILEKRSSAEAVLKDEGEDRNGTAS